jgi:hypothetical protein
MICLRISPDRKVILSAACVFAFTALVGIAAAAEVSAIRLDGSTTSGDLRAWSNNEVVVATSSGDQHIATSQLIALRRQPGSAAPGSTDNNAGQVELIDGSILPIKSIQIKESKADITLASPAKPQKKTLALPLSQLANVRFKRLDPPVIKQWNEIRHLNLANDVLAVLKKDGTSLDYVEGVMGDVSADKIEFKLDGEMQHVDRAKIAGAVYYRPDRRTPQKPRAALQGRSGVRLNATRMELKDSVLHVTTAAGAQIDWPLDDISLADFSAGKLMYLSDVEAASENWTPLVGLPAAATIAFEYGQPRRDKSAFGGPLSLVAKEDESAITPAATKTFHKGLAVHSRTEIVYRLPTGFRRFIALAGIDPATSAVGNVRLIISGDDRVLLDTDVAGDQPPHPIQLDIANVKRLKIIVDYGKNLDTGDWLNLCDARIVK